MEIEEEVEQAAARLRKSRAQYEEGEDLDGQAAGRQWVLEHAEYPEVLALAEFKLSGSPEHAWSELSTLLDEKSPTYDVDDLRDLLLGDRDAADPSSAWVQGFVEGAKATWAELRDKV